MTTKLTKIAIATAIAGAVALPASGALAASKTERAIIGALIGGVAGAAVSNGKTEGVAIGAVAGAALGAATKDNDRRYHRSYRETRPYYNDTGYYRTNDRRSYQTYNRGYQTYNRGYQGRYSNQNPYGYNDYYGYRR